MRSVSILIAAALGIGALTPALSAPRTPPAPTNKTADDHGAKPAKHGHCDGDDGRTDQYRHLRTGGENDRRADLRADLRNDTKDRDDD